MEKEPVLLHCSNNCQNDVIIHSVEIPLFLQASSSENLVLTLVMGMNCLLISKYLFA